MSLITDLTPWQKKQASLLYFFSSDDYLKGLHSRVRDLQNFADTILNVSLAEDRDRYLRSSQWGDRDTSENWSNHAWSFLADFGVSVAKDIADRASNVYRVTGTYQCGRGMSEYSMQWTTPAEQEQFDAMFNSISDYAEYIDKTMNTSHRAGRWNDFNLSLAWQKHASSFPKLPKFKIHDGISCASGEAPPKTGVYVSTDFADGILQFAWSGNEYGKLRQCSIFNDIGQQALAAVGRSKIWVDAEAMLAFVQKNADATELKNDSFYRNPLKPELAPSLVARHAFTSASSKWCYVELLEGEFEDIEMEAVLPSHEVRHSEAGKRCETSGFYFSPASSYSRRFFKQGDIFSKLDACYGTTIWQWDEKQQ